VVSVLSGILEETAERVGPSAVQAEPVVPQVSVVKRTLVDLSA
jgi:hypothetical protein